MKTIYIYMLIDPRTLECRYVGQTMRPTYRMSQHLSLSDLSTKKTIWVASLRYLGVQPEMVILEEVGQDQGRGAEKFWIGYMRFIGCDLTNATDVGDGRQHSPATRQKFRAVWANVDHRKHRVAGIKKSLNTPAHKALQSIISRASWTKTRTKRIASLLASWKGADDRRQRTSEQTLARWADPATAEKLRKGLEAYHADPQYHEKHRASTMEAFNRPEVRANRSRITSELWADPVHRAKRMASMNTPEVKEKQRKLAKEKQTPEMRKKISDGFTPEMRGQISQARKAYWAKWREEKGLPPKEPQQ